MSVGSQEVEYTHEVPFEGILLLDCILRQAVTDLRDGIHMWNLKQFFMHESGTGISSEEGCQLLKITYQW